MLQSRTALINKVADEIRQRVADGTYSHRIPAATALGQELGVNRDAAWRAVRILKDEGLLVTAGPRTYVKNSFEADACAGDGTGAGAEQPLAMTSAASAAPAAPRSVAAPPGQCGPATGMAAISADDLREAIQQPGAFFMTVEEFVKFTRPSKMTVYRLIHDGELGATRMGPRCFRIPIDSAVEFLKGSGSWRPAGPESGCG